MPSVLDRASSIIADAIREDREGDDQSGLSGPNRVALACQQSIAELEAEKDRVPRSQRRRINQRLALLREMLTWCKSRSGYQD